MLYHHHGINFSFTGNYHEYFSYATNIDAMVYLALANEVTHKLVPSAVTIAEDVSGMPTLCRRVEEGGVGFDYRSDVSLLLPRCRTSCEAMQRDCTPETAEHCAAVFVTPFLACQMPF